MNLHLMIVVLVAMGERNQENTGELAPTITHELT
jgi:hypothetical protein